MLAPLLLFLVPTSQAETAPEEPRFASLILTEGIRGGFIAPIVRRRAELGYDWNAARYRITLYEGSRRESAEGPYSTAVLSRREFEEILHEVRELGLETLPPQPDPEGPDTYGLDTGVELRDLDLVWQNLAAGGCTSNPAEVVPTEDERQAFALVVERIQDRISRIELEPGCELDSGFLVAPSDHGEARAFLKALEHVLRQPFVALVDRSRVDVLSSAGHYEFRFAWRALQDLEYRHSRMRRKESYEVSIDRETLAVRGARGRPFEQPAETLARRRAFFESHPGLPSRLRRLISTGWVGSGMTREMVTAAWGEPVSTDPLTYERHGERVRLHFEREVLRYGPRLSPPLAWPRSRRE